MGQFAFAAALGAGAALISVWTDLQLHGHRPKSTQLRFLHACIAFVLLQVAVAVAARVGGAGATREERMAATFLLLLPSLVYAFLALLWLLRTLAETARSPCR
jgi:hypothetical protein